MNNERKSGSMANSKTAIWRKIAFVLIFVMLAGSITGLGILLFENNALDEVGTSDGGQVKEAAINGDGTAANPFELWTLADLVEMRDKVNSGGTIAGTTVAARTASYKLMADIDLSSYSSGVGWVPIGDYNTTSAIFSGVFDGNNNAIKNIYAKATYVSGFFGAIGNSIIKNLGIIGGMVETIGAGNYCFAGGVSALLVGNSNIISDCYNTATISGPQNITTSGGMVGGVVGSRYTVAGNDTISRCFNVGSVSGGWSGGIIGYNYYPSGTGILKIESCFNAGIVKGVCLAGGILATATDGSGVSTQISDCYNIGNITTTDTIVGNVRAAGGIAGGCCVAGGATLSFARCYNTGVVSMAVVNTGIGSIYGSNGGSTSSSVSNVYWNTSKAPNSVSNKPIANTTNATGITQANMTGSSALTNMPNLGSGFVNSATDSYPQLACFANSTNPAIRAYSAASVVATGYVDPGYRPNIAPICNNPTSITINDTEGANYTVSVGTVGGVDGNTSPYNRTLEFVTESVSITEGSEWVEIVGTTANGIILKSKNLTSTNQFAKIAFTITQAAKDGLEQKTCSGVINITVPMVPN